MGKKKYDNDYPSVTQALNVLRKIGLEIWFKQNTAAFCDAKSAKGKIIGTQIHDVIYANIMGLPAQVVTEYPVEVTNALNSYLLFKKEHPEITMRFAETTLISHKWRFNGTMDADLERLDKEIAGDWKSGECKKKKIKVAGRMVETEEFNERPKIYEEAKYQISAYIVAKNEMFGTKIENGIIVSLAKDTVAYGLHEMDKHEIESHFYDAFLPCLKIYNHQRRTF